MYTLVCFPSYVCTYCRVLLAVALNQVITAGFTISSFYSVIYVYTAIRHVTIRVWDICLLVPAASAPAAREKSLQCTSNLRGVTLSVNCNPATSSAACRINGEPPSLCKHDAPCMLPHPSCIVQACHLHYTFRMSVIVSLIPMHGHAGTFPLSKDVSQLSAGNHRLVISTPDISVPTVINFTIPGEYNWPI